MGVFDKFARRFGYVKAGRRDFSGAKVSRLTASWVQSPVHLNRSLLADRGRLVARARDLAKNNDYAKRFLGMVKTNVVGHSGFSMQVQALRPDGTIDQADSDRLETAFAKWAKRGVCEVTGQLSLVDVERLFIETLARDGEVAVREVTRGPFGYQLELVDPQLIDDQYNDSFEGRQIRMGVERDAFYAPVAYWLKNVDSSDPTQYADSTQRHIRVPATEMKLFYLHEFVRQLRGVPWMSSAMMRMNMLGGYEEAAVVAARIGAAKLGILQSPNGEADDVATGYEGEGEAARPQLDSGEPGEFITAPAGYEFKEWDPDYPHEQYGAFVKACLRGISSGLLVSYNGLANDLEGVNFSSIRAGVLEEREVWKALQSWMIEAFLEPIYSAWLPRAIATGQVNLPMSKLSKFDAVVWQGRRWDWVDPEKDVNANVTSITNRLKSYSQVIREQGRDPEEVWRELAKDTERLKALGISVVVPAPASAPAPKPKDDSALAE